MTAPLKPSDPADKALDAVADGQFQAPATGFASAYEMVVHFARKGGTLKAGEGLLLVQRIEALEAQLACPSCGATGCLTCWKCGRKR